MKVKARESMEKEGGELVQAVEDHAVVPHDDGGHEAPHAQHIVSLGRIVIGVVRCYTYWKYLPCTSQDSQDKDQSAR